MLLIGKTNYAQRQLGLLILIFILHLMIAGYFDLCFGTQMSGKQVSPHDLFSSEDFLNHTAFSDSDDQLILMAKAQFKQGRFKQAVAYARVVLSKDYSNVQAQGIIGAVHALSGQMVVVQKELDAFFSELIKAVSYAQKGNFKKAQKHLTECLKEQPGHPVAINYKGSIFLAQKKYKPAIKAFEQVIQIQPEFIQAFSGLGQAYLQIQEMEKAASCYERAASLNPENLLYRKELLKIYQDTGQKDLADRQIREILYYTPGVKEEYLKKGGQLLVIGAYEEAKKLMEKVHDIYEGVPLALYIKGAACANLGQTDQALEAIEEFLRFNKKSTLAHHYAGMCYMALEIYEKAEKEFIKAITINPNMGKSFIPMTVIEQLNNNFARALEGLDMARREGEPAALTDFLSAQILLQQKNNQDFFKKMENGVKLVPGLKNSKNLSFPGDKNRDYCAEKRNLMVLFFYNGWYGQVLKISRDLLEKNPGDRFALYYKALSEQTQNKNNDAIQSFISLLKLEKNLISANMGLGQLYLKSHDIKNAANSFQKVVDINPSYSPAHKALGDIALMNDKEGKAVNYYKKALEINPDDVSLYPKLIILLSQDRDNLPQAAQYAEKLETFSPKDPYSLDALGWLSLNQKKYEKGFKLIQKAHKLLPKKPLILYHLGIACYQSKELEAAEKYLQASIDSADNFSGRDHAQEVLKEISAY